VSLATLLFLQRILARQQLAVGAPDFRDAALATIVALDELAEAIEAAEAEANPEGIRSPDPANP
jgi:hypothetical protein